MLKGVESPRGRYRMDYMAFVMAHRTSGADITIGCLPCDGERAQDFGLMKIDTDGNVVVRLSAAMAQTHLVPHPHLICNRGKLIILYTLLRATSNTAWRGALRSTSLDVQSGAHVILFCHVI